MAARRAEIRGIALQILMWDLEVPAESVDVKVDEGWITLTGNVSYQFESDAAYDDVTGVYGVYGVTNEVTVSRPLSMSTRAGARLRRLHVGGYIPGVARAGPAASRYSREVKHGTAAVRSLGRGSGRRDRGSTSRRPLPAGRGRQESRPGIPRGRAGVLAAVRLLCVLLRGRVEVLTSGVGVEGEAEDADREQGEPVHRHEDALAAFTVQGARDEFRRKRQERHDEQ